MSPKSIRDRRVILVLALSVLGLAPIIAQQAERLPLVDEHQPLDWEAVSLALLVQEVEAAAAEEELVDFAVEVLDNTISIVYRDLQFPPDSPEITAETGAKIEGLARVIQRFSNRRLQVEGHTAAIAGDDDDGTILSGQRANAVADTIARSGIFARDMISAVGQGQFEPIATNDTPEGRALNRRVEISIVDEIEQGRSAPQSQWWKQLTDWKDPGATVFVVDPRLTTESAVRAALQAEQERTGARIGDLPIFETSEGYAVIYDEAEFTEQDRPTGATVNEIVYVSNALASLDPNAQVRIGGFGEDVPQDRVFARHYELGLVVATDSEIRPSSTLLGDTPQTFLFLDTCDDGTGILHSVELSGNAALPLSRYAQFSRAAFGGGAKFDVLIPAFQHREGLAPIRFGLAVEGLYHLPETTSSVDSLWEFDWLLTAGYAVAVGRRVIVTPHLGYGGTVQTIEYTQEENPTTFTAVSGRAHYSQTAAAELDLAWRPASWIVGETTQVGLFLRPGYRIFFDESFLGQTITGRIGVRFYF